MRALVSTRKGLFELYSHQNQWHIDQVSFIGEPVSVCLPDRRNGALYAALNLGHFGVKLHAREKNSRDWVELATPTYPHQGEKIDGDVEWKLKQIWCLEPGGRHEKNVLWAGTLPGGLFKSTDAGLSWELVSSLWHREERRAWFGGGYDTPGIHSIVVDPRDSNHVLVGISCGGVWRTRDAGVTWALSASGMRANFMPPELADDQNVQDPHRIVQCAHHPDQLWCQHHGGIWRSTDHAASWHSVATPEGMSDFGFATAVHPRDPNTAWFIPLHSDQRRIPVAASLSVSRTRDGGQTFERLSEGLPQAHCYDLIYRHGLDVASDGQHLIMGSSTGHVWTSANAGESWQQVDALLPPIYAVRFNEND